MKFYLAPFDGITDIYYRRLAARQYGKDIDKFFTAFLPPCLNTDKNQKEVKEILPEYNQGVTLVPQTLTASAEDGIHFLGEMRKFQYPEINFNIGCPSNGVVGKGRGAGFLAKPDELDRFLYSVFEEVQKYHDCRVSVKTRIGKKDPEEFERILSVYNQYPLSELIIHPRTGKQHYQGEVHLDAFYLAMEQSKNPICYNGDIFKAKHYHILMEDLKRRPGRTPDAVMVGRGFLANPALIREIKGGEPLQAKELRNYVDGYYQILKENLIEKTVAGRLKELWFFIKFLMPDAKEKVVALMRSRSLQELLMIQEELLNHFENKEESKE